MHWNEVPGPDQVEHHLQLFLTGMAVYMNGGDAVVKHSCSLAHQVIYGPANAQFVAWDRGRGDYHRVSLYHADVPVVFVGYADQG